jgi:hypothetical protein
MTGVPVQQSRPMKQLLEKQTLANRMMFDVRIIICGSVHKNMYATLSK